MQFHSKAQEQSLKHLQAQYETAVAGIQNNELLSEEEKLKALKEELQNYKQKKKGLQGSIF